MSEIVTGAAKALTKQGFLKGATARSAREYWEKFGGCAIVLERLLRNWLSKSPMSAAKFENANLKFSSDLSRLHQAMKHDGDSFRVTPFGLCLMIILRVPGASTFASHCAQAYALLRKIYIRDADKPFIRIDDFQAQLKVEDLEFQRVFLILSELSAGNLSISGYDKLVFASPSIRRYADIWAALEAMMPSYSTDAIQFQFPSDIMLSNISVNSNPIGFKDLLHPIILEKTLPLYQDAHYREAILSSVIVLFDLIRARAGLTQDGSALVTEALSVDRARLVLSELDTESGRNDQKGFMQITLGIYQGIRNPRAHSLDHDADEREAAQYLIFISLVIQRIEDAVLVHPA